MKKEIWILVFLLGVIFGVIWIFSKWNSKHLMKKLKRIRKEQEVICKYMDDKAKKFNINWDEKNCKNIIIGKNPKDWKQLKKCISHKKRNFLMCMGNTLCKQGDTEGCILKYEINLQSDNSKKQKTSEKLLADLCKSKNSKACSTLALWYENHPKNKLYSIQKEINFKKKACLSGNISMCKTPTYILSLEQCASENIDFCSKSYTKTSSPVVLWLACSYGNGDACNLYYENLLGIKFSFQNSKTYFSTLLPEMCLNGSWKSCGFIAKIRGNKQLTLISCKNGDAFSCKQILNKQKDYKISPLTFKFIKYNLCKMGNFQYCKKTDG